MMRLSWLRQNIARRARGLCVIVTAAFTRECQQHGHHVLVMYDVDDDVYDSGVCVCIIMISMVVLTVAMSQYDMCVVR